jgi:hypothetical protein
MPRGSASTACPAAPAPPSRPGRERHRQADGRDEGAARQPQDAGLRRGWQPRLHAPNDRRAYDDAFPKTLNYHFDHRGWQFVGLDTTQGFAGSNTVIAKETLDYLAATLKQLDPKRPTVLFTHFPLGWLLPARPANAQALLQHFVDHNLQAVFNGHFHSQTTRVWGGCELTTNTCCSLRRKNHDLDPRKGYFLAQAKNGTIKRKYVQVNA